MRQKKIFYTLSTTVFQQNRIFKIDIQNRPGRIVDEIFINDANKILSAAGGRVNLDPEGIDSASDGGFWFVSEGRGTAGDEDRPIETENQIFKLDSLGTIKKVYTLPSEVSAKQLRFGLEGVSESNGQVVVVFQRAWVGLSDITAVGANQFLILERDNQGGPDPDEPHIAGASGGAYFEILPDTRDNHDQPLIKEGSAANFYPIACTGPEVIYPISLQKPGRGCGLTLRARKTTALIMA